MDPVRIMLVAGEPSGDVLGARLIAGLRDLAGDRLQIMGIGGTEMAAQGLDSLFPMETLSVMGLFEVLPRALRLRRCIAQAEALVRAERPDCLVTIDSPGFNRRLVSRIQDMDLLKVHYVAPSVWAYHPHRAAKIAALYDHLLTLLPFEPPLFEVEGLPASFVGHPAIEAERHRSGDSRGFRKRHGIPVPAPVIGVLFGSRKGELRRMGGIFVDALREVLRAVPDAVIVAPTLPSLRPVVEKLLSGLDARSVVVEPEEKLDAFHAVDVALAASGTVALELALAGTPAVVAYRLNPLTAMIARRVIRIPWASLVNILMKTMIVPELLQENCRPDRIAPELVRALRDSASRDRQIEAGRIVAAMLRPGELWPSDKAARVVMNLVEQRKGK